MRESGAEGSEGRAKLRDERHSHIIRGENERERERRFAVGRDPRAKHMRVQAAHVHSLIKQRGQTSRKSL